MPVLDLLDQTIYDKAPGGSQLLILQVFSRGKFPTAHIYTIECS
jgi:hypothetical protein